MRETPLTRLLQVKACVALGSSSDSTQIDRRRLRSHSLAGEQLGDDRLPRTRIRHGDVDARREQAAELQRRVHGGRRSRDADARQRRVRLQRARVRHRIAQALDQLQRPQAVRVAAAFASLQNRAQSEDSTRERQARGTRAGSSLSMSSNTIRLGAN